MLTGKGKKLPVTNVSSNLNFSGRIFDNLILNHRLTSERRDSSVGNDQVSRIRKSD